MAILIQATCLMFLLGMISSWPFPLIFERRVPVTYIHTSVEEGSSSPSLFDEMNRLMATMHEHVQHMFNWPSHPIDMYEDGDYDLLGNEDRLNPMDDLMVNERKSYMADELSEIRMRLDNIEPVCTTITDSPTTISPRKSRRKKLRGTQTTTCTRELIVNGQIHTSEEINTTDDKGVSIKHSKTYGLITVDADQNRE